MVTENKYRIKMTEMSPDIKALVTTAQHCVRLRVALKFAWTEERAVKTLRLPTAGSMIEACLREAYGRHAGTKGGKVMKAAYLSLQDQEGQNNEQVAEMRKKVYTVVSA